MVINLGSGHIRLQASAKALNDGHWHSAVMERSGRRGFLTVDALRTDFSCPGRSANLNIDEPIYVGAVPWENGFSARKNVPEAVTVIQLTVDGHGGVGAPTTVHQYPSTVWTIGLRVGFVGCLKNIRVNGINAQIAHAFRAATQHLSSAEIRDVHGRDETASAPLSAGCPFSFAVDYCSFGASPRGGGGTAAPCRNGGICSNAHNAHRCDCSNTAFEGPNCTYKPRPVQFPLGFFGAVSARPLSTAGGDWQSEAEDILVKFRLPPASTIMTGGTGSGLMVLLDAIGGQPESPDGRLLLAVVGGTVAGGLVVDWVFANGEEKTLHWAHNTTAGAGNIADGNWHAAKVRRRGRSVSLSIDGQWSHHQLNNVQNPVLSIDDLVIGVPLGPPRLKNQMEHFFNFHGDLRHFTMNGFDLLKLFGPSTTSVNFGGPKKDTQRQKGVQSTEIIHHSTTTKKMVMTTTHHRIGEKYELFSSTSPTPLKHHSHHHHHHKQQKHQQQQFANDSFFTKAPLGCLRQNEQQSCEPEQIGTDGFFTPVLPKPLRKVSSSSTTKPSSTSPVPRSHVTTFPRRTKASTTKRTTTTESTTPITTAPTVAAASSPASRSPSPSSTTTAAATNGGEASFVAGGGVVMASTSSSSSLVLSGSMAHQVDDGSQSIADVQYRQHDHLHRHQHHRQRVLQPMPAETQAVPSSSAEQQQQLADSSSGGYYEPRGGWPLRTRTWPDGRRVGPDGTVLKWQRLRPKVVLPPPPSTATRTTRTTTMATPTTSTSTRRTTTTTSATTATSTSSSTTIVPKTITTTTIRRLPMMTETVAKGVPGLHFTFMAPPITRRPSTFARTTPAAARFSVAPNDPTLYAVRPTTPMNGLGLASSTPTMSTLDTSNQLGDDKKILIGVGSLSIVVMVGAILLCVFCKRCNSLCSQLANAAGAASGAGGAQVASGAGLKAGYAPIPPNEYASPQLQHHAMATFERNGHQGGAMPPSSVALRSNGAGAGGTLGNGMATSMATTTAGGATRVVLANGSGTAAQGGGGGARVAHETTSLINAAASASAGGGAMVSAPRSAVAGGQPQHYQQQQHTRAGDEARKRDFKEWYV
ncbi:hypothetical protein niasHS_005472 [Heterodera schachtii]|uniref:Uncharacterized protein n=1 Tax=Heterodera schachtii TaxID=97005 RepID=A0ABD2JIV4_HETSC